jgi:uncharacterized protein (TIGR03437 family)
MRKWLAVCLTIGATTARAQVPSAPVVNPRGVINAFTLQPAPTVVAPGGILWINGINLGPPEGWKAEGAPLPTSAGDPAIEVRIGNRAIPLYSITPGRIVAQVPVDTPAGLTQLVVRRGQQQSRPARFLVTQPSPSISTANGQGYGAAGTMAANAVTLRVTGLGQTDPPQEPGALPVADAIAVPRIAIRANAGGLPAEAAAKLSAEKVGEFEVTLTMPEGARDGDVITLYSGNAPGNRVTLNALAAPDTKYVRLPAPTMALRGLTASDLRPGFLVLSEQRNSEGCWPSILVDFDANKAEGMGGCYTSAMAQAPSPFTPVNEGAALGALIGPPEGDAQSGVSARVAILQPRSRTMEVELPGKALTLNPAANGTWNAILGGSPLRVAQINPSTGDVTEVAGGGGGLPGGGGGGGGGIVNIANLEIDLGDGVKEVVAVPLGVGQGLQAVVAVDSASAPKKAKFALINNQLQPQSTVDFPANWLPLLAPPQAPPPGGQVPPGGGQPVVNRLRAAVQFDGPTRQYYVLARAEDQSRDGFVRFPLLPNQPEMQPGTLPFDSGVFASSCTPQIRLFNLELSRRVAVATATTAENAIRNPCGATGFVTLDLATRELAAAMLPGSGQINVTGNSANEVNDYIYGANTSPAAQNRADTLFVFDGVTSSSFRVDLPPEIASFANLTPFPPMGILFGQATRTAAGDAGIVIFDLESASGRLLPTPAGFASTQPLAIFPATRKLVARGARTEPASSQLLIYDLVTSELTIVPNPEGVAFLGQLPAVAGGGQPGQPPGPGGGGQPQQQVVLQSINPKANAVAMVGYDAQRRAVGVFLVRVH